jgi:hypothetical protein
VRLAAFCRALLAFGATERALFTERVRRVKKFKRFQTDMPAIDKETAFAELVRAYEDQWIAIDDRDGVKFIVGSGRDAVEAAEDAEAKGFPDAVLLRVPSFSSTFIPLAALAASH